MNKENIEKLKEVSEILFGEIDEFLKFLLIAKDIDELCAFFDAEDEEMQEYLQESYTNLCDTVSSYKSLVRTVAALIMLRKFKQEQ